MKNPPTELVSWTSVISTMKWKWKDNLYQNHYTLITLVFNSYQRYHMLLYAHAKGLLYSRFFIKFGDYMYIWSLNSLFLVTLNKWVWLEWSPCGCCCCHELFDFFDLSCDHVFQVILSAEFPCKFGSRVYKLLIDLFLFHDFSVVNFIRGVQVQKMINKIFMKELFMLFASINLFLNHWIRNANLLHLAWKYLEFKNIEKKYW